MHVSLSHGHIHRNGPTTGTRDDHPSPRWRMSASSICVEPSTHLLQRRRPGNHAGPSSATPTRCRAPTRAAPRTSTTCAPGGVFTSLSPPRAPRTHLKVLAALEMRGRGRSWSWVRSRDSPIMGSGRSATFDMTPFDQKSRRSWGRMSWRCAGVTTACPSNAAWAWARLTASCVKRRRNSPDTARV